jgi:enoyl-CoA hydratase/carnithine racemase
MNPQSPAATEQDQGTVRFTKDGAVARLVFDRPRARNAMTWRMYEELADACEKIATDPEATDDDLDHMCYGSADFREGVAAFVGKRRAAWRGE